MSDPEAAQDLPPPQPVCQEASSGPTPQSQLEADERYARQLADHYKNASRDIVPGALKNNDRKNNLMENHRSHVPPEERSFIDDDLPVIKESLKKGFLETQTKVNTWITNIKKKIDGIDDEYVPKRYVSSSQSHRSNDFGRRKSDDYSPYDADPQVLSDDFAGMQFNADGSK